MTRYKVKVSNEDMMNLVRDYLANLVTIHVESKRRFFFGVSGITPEIIQVLNDMGAVVSEDFCHSLDVII